MRKSLQVELNNFGKFMQLPLISKQVFSAARKKLLPAAFIELNKTLIQEFYYDNEFKKFLGYRLIVVDGSTLQLPEGDSIKEKYGTCSNQKEGMSMARISHAYDPLNGITLNAIMEPYKTSEREIVFDHILNIPHSSNSEDLYLFDRMEQMKREAALERESVERAAGGQLLANLVQNTAGGNYNNISQAQIKELGAYLGKWSLARGTDQNPLGDLMEQVPRETKIAIYRAIRESADPGIAQNAREFLARWITTGRPGLD